MESDTGKPYETQKMTVKTSNKIAEVPLVWKKLCILLHVNIIVLDNSLKTHLSKLHIHAKLN